MKNIILFILLICNLESKITQDDINFLLTPTLKDDYKIYEVFGAKEKVLSVQGIFNKKVLLRDSWFSVGDKISNLYIVEITDKFIILKDKKGKEQKLKIIQDK